MKYHPSALIVLTLSTAHAFVCPNNVQRLNFDKFAISNDNQKHQLFRNNELLHYIGSSSLVSLQMAGFGTSSSDSDGKKKPDKKLKPKQQWDRYQDLKRESKIRVGVRMEDSEEWLEVGRVKSKDNAYTEIAVARQRALISEHSKRLYPLRVNNKSKMEWAYFQEESEEWVAVDKSVLTEQDVPKNIEKLIGFEGRPDPASGFYCVYDNGRIK